MVKVSHCFTLNICLDLNNMAMICLVKENSVVEFKTFFMSFPQVNYNLKKIFLWCLDIGFQYLYVGKLWNNVSVYIFKTETSWHFSTVFSFWHVCMD